jgi:hypothetical protein
VGAPSGVPEIIRKLFDLVMTESYKPVPVHGQLSLFVSRTRIFHSLAGMSLAGIFVPREMFLLAVVLGRAVGVGSQVVEFGCALVIFVV